MRKFYSAESQRGSETSHGFSNDTIVNVFSSRQARDAYVNTSRNLSCVAIRKNEVTSNATNDDHKPQPFTGQFWGINTMYESEEIGLVGVIEVCNESDSVERLF